MIMDRQQLTSLTTAPHAAEMAELAA